MRRLLTFLTALVLSLVSLAIGLVAADLPFWRRAMQLPLPADTLYLPIVTIDGGASVSAASVSAGETGADRAAVDQRALEGAVATARDAGSRALLVARNGTLLLSRYFGADDQRSLLPAGLVTRPLVAMSVGLTLASREIESLDVPISRYLPEWDDEPRGRITLRQLLEETSGLENGGDLHKLLRRSPWEDPGSLAGFATAKGVRLLLGNDFAATALRFELRHEPGGFYNESPANPQLAALIVERATGMPYERFVERQLWRVLGADHAELTLDRRAGMPAAHCCWRATAPDMMRVVSLLATAGANGGQAVLPPEWVREMARASRVNADSGLQLKRVSVDGQLALSDGDYDGSAFWVFPDRRLAIVNIVNSEGTSPPELPALLLRSLGESEPSK